MYWHKSSVVVMTKQSSYMFVTGPNVVKTVTHEEVTSEEKAVEPKEKSKKENARKTSPNKNR